MSVDAVVRIPQCQIFQVAVIFLKLPVHRIIQEAVDGKGLEGPVQGEVHCQQKGRKNQESYGESSGHLSASELKVDKHLLVQDTEQQNKKDKPYINRPAQGNMLRRQHPDKIMLFMQIFGNQ